MPASRVASHERKWADAVVWIESASSVNKREQRSDDEAHDENDVRGRCCRHVGSQGLKPFVLAERDCRHNGTNYSALVEWNS